MEFKGVAITEEGIAEMDEGRILQHVAAKDIQAISLQYGSQVKHPLLQAALGIGLVTFSLYPLQAVSKWFLEGGVQVDITFLLCLTFPFGLWVLWEALRRGYFLAVRSQRDKRKIAFQKVADVEELRRFLQEANKTFGYGIAVDIG